MAECVTGILVDLSCSDTNVARPKGGRPAEDTTRSASTSNKASKEISKWLSRSKSMFDVGIKDTFLHKGFDVCPNERKLGRQLKCPEVTATTSDESEGDLLEDEVFDFGDLSRSPLLCLSDDEVFCNNNLEMKENCLPARRNLLNMENILSAQELVEVFKEATVVAAQLHDFRTHSDPGSLVPLKTSPSYPRIKEQKICGSLKRATQAIVLSNVITPFKADAGLNDNLYGEDKEIVAPTQLCVITLDGVTDDVFKKDKFNDDVVKKDEFPDDVVKKDEFLDDVAKKDEFPDDVVKKDEFPDDVVKKDEFPDDVAKKDEFPDDVVKKNEFPDDVVKKDEFPDDVVKKDIIDVVAKCVYAGDAATEKDVWDVATKLVDITDAAAKCVGITDFVSKTDNVTVCDSYDVVERLELISSEKNVPAVFRPSDQNVCATCEEHAKSGVTVILDDVQSIEVSDDQPVDSTVAPVPQLVAAPVLAPASKMTARKADSSMSSQLRTNRMKATNVNSLARNKPFRAVEIGAALTGIIAAQDIRNQRIMSGPKTSVRRVDQLEKSIAKDSPLPSQMIKGCSATVTKKPSTPAPAVAMVNSFRRSQGLPPAVEPTAPSTINRRRSDIPSGGAWATPVPRFAVPPARGAAASSFGPVEDRTKSSLRTSGPIGIAAANDPLYAGTSFIAGATNMRRSVGGGQVTPFKSPAPQPLASASRPSTPSRIPGLTRANSFTASQRPKPSLALSNSFSGVRSRPTYVRVEATSSKVSV